MFAKHVRVLVRRDMAESIPVEVFEHEVEVLKDVHGEGNVSLIDTLPDVKPVEVDAGEEMERLLSHYGAADNGVAYAERVFGRSHRGLEAYAHKPAKKGAAAEAKKGAAAEAKNGAAAEEGTE